MYFFYGNSNITYDKLIKQRDQYYAKVKNCLFFVSGLPKDVQTNKKYDDIFVVDDDDDGESIIFSPEKPISSNSNNVSNKCIQIILD